MAEEIAQLRSPLADRVVISPLAIEYAVPFASCFEGVQMAAGLSHHVLQNAVQTRQRGVVAHLDASPDGRLDAAQSDLEATDARQ